MVKDFGAFELEAFLNSGFKAEEKYIRRLNKVNLLEKDGLHLP